MDATEQARSLIAEGATTEDVLARLRQAGHDQSESRKALRESAGMTVWEARRGHLAVSSASRYTSGTTPR